MIKKLRTKIGSGPPPRRAPEGGGEQVVAHIRQLIDAGVLGPGDRLPAERDLAAQLGVSRPTVRAGLHALAAMGVVQTRHGSGTYIPEGPPVLVPGPLTFQAALHGFTRDQMYEARRIMEVGAAALAASRATPEQLATLADHVAGLFASLADPQLFLVHDIDFHRGVATASGNPIVASLVEMLAALYYERRRRTAELASTRNLRDAAEAHQRIYRAIRAHDADASAHAMEDHLMQSSQYQAEEPAAEAASNQAGDTPRRPSKRTDDKHA